MNVLSVTETGRKILLFVTSNCDQCLFLDISQARIDALECMGVMQASSQSKWAPSTTAALRLCAEAILGSDKAAAVMALAASILKSV